MSRHVIIKMTDGFECNVTGYASAVQAKVNKARSDDSSDLLALERNTIRAGEMVYVDPHEIVSIRTS